MNSTTSSEIDLMLPTTHVKREADDWLLVLTAEGIPARLRHGEGGITLEVAPENQIRAKEILVAWRAERKERAKRLNFPVPRNATSFEMAASYAFALSLLAFHLGLQAADQWTDFRSAGAAKAALILDGQWWRLVTALTLHADLPHVVGNTLFGGFFLAAVVGRLGIGFGILGFVVTGALGNFANALYYESAHSSIGASTGVFGLVGILAGLAAWRRHYTAPPKRGAWVAFAAGLGIVAMLGGGGPGIDFSAHLFGLIAGAATGLILAAPFALRVQPHWPAQAIALCGAVTVVLIAWSQTGA